MKSIAAVGVDSVAGYAHRVQARRHEFGADEPAERGGSDTGAAPYEILLGALGACTAITLAMYAKRKQWNLGAVSVTLRFLKDHDEERIERDVHCSAELSGPQREKLLDICGKTPVTKTLLRGTPIATRLL